MSLIVVVNIKMLNISIKQLRYSSFYCAIPGAALEMKPRGALFTSIK